MLGDNRLSLVADQVHFHPNENLRKNFANICADGQA